MLIQTDTNQGPIKAQDRVEWTRNEHLTAEKDHLKRESDPIAPDAAGVDVTNSGARMGRSMTAWTFTEKLQKIAPFLYFERSNSDPSKTGIYVRAHRRDVSLYKGDLQFICGMESGIMPEFSIIEAEAKLVPDPNAKGGRRMEYGMAREVRGWRTVLARLLKNQILTAGQIEKYFQISLGRDSAKWQQLLAGELDVISTTTDITEEIHAGNEGQDRGDQGSAGENGERSGTPDDGPGDGQECVGDVHDGTTDDAHQGDPEAGRRDAAEEGGGGSAASGIHAPDDRAGQCGD